MKKTILSLLLVFCLLIVAGPAMDTDADAATAYTDGYFTYTVKDGLASITGYTGNATTVVIPSMVGGYLVDTIEEKAFQGKQMQYIVFPDTLMKIGNRAFANCAQLKEVTLPLQLASLGQRSFENCYSLEKITVECAALSVPRWGDSTYKAQPFYQAGRASANGIAVVFTDTVTTVPMRLFYPESGAQYCPKVTSVTFADSVTEISESAFENHKYLQKIDFGNGVETIGEKAFKNCTALTNIIFPSNTLRTIGESTFQGCTALPQVSFPNSLTTIGHYAFEGCNGLTSVTLPRDLANLGQRSFANCKNLTNITVNSTALKNIVTWGDPDYKGQPFYNAGISKSGITVNFASGATRVPKDMFNPQSGSGYAPKVVAVTLADTVTEIGANAFANCIYLNTVDLGDGLPEIGEAAFKGCTALTNVTFPAKKLKTIGEYAFNGCTALTSVSLPASVTTIGEYAFRGCIALKNIAFPVSLTTIDNYAFEGCSAFTSVTLPKNLTVLGQRSFANLPYLTKITVKSTALGNIPYWGESSFRAQPFYNSGNAGDGVSVSFDSGATRVPKNMFYPHSGTGYAPKIVTVTVADTVKEIGENAFRDCQYLKSVDMGDGVTEIGAYAFANSYALTTLPISKKLTKIGSYAFEGCTGIKSMILPQTLSYVDSYAFKGCTGLSYIRFLSQVPTLGYNMFEGVTMSVFYPKNLNWAESHLKNYNGTITWRGFHVAKIASQTAAGYAKLNEKVTVKVNAQGEDLKYVWYFKNAGDKKYSKSSTTGATYSTTMNSDTKGRLVYCIVTDKYGCKVRSETVPLRQQVSITTQPKSVTVKYGAKATVSVKAIGTGLKYAWYTKSAGASKYTKSSVTKSTYSVTMNDKSQGRCVYCVVTDKYGKTAKSKTVQLKMKATVLTQPKTAYAKSGAKAKVTVKADGDGLTYAWYVKSANGSSYSKSSAKTATYTATMDSKTKDRYVYCIVKDKYGNKVKTDVVRLRMAATVKTQPKSTAVVSGKTAKVTVKAVGDGLKYTWYVKNKGASKFTKASTTSATYSVKMTSKVNGRQVYCVVKDKYGKTVKTSTATLKLKK